METRAGDGNVDRLLGGKLQPTISYRARQPSHAQELEHPAIKWVSWISDGNFALAGFIA